jgi:hypothetical protein
LGVGQKGAVGQVDHRFTRVTRWRKRHEEGRITQVDHGKLVFDLDFIGRQTKADPNNKGAAFHRHRSRLPTAFPATAFPARLFWPCWLFSMAGAGETTKPLP